VSKPSEEEDEEEEEEEEKEKEKEEAETLTVKLARAGNSWRPKPGTLLQPGDEITTGKRTTAFVEFQKASEIVMMPETHVEIENPTIRIWFGRIIAGIRAKFRVKTKYVTAGAEGTKFTMSVGKDGETTVKMIVGRIKLTSNENRWPSVSLGPGEQARIWSGQEPQIERISPQEYEQIVKSIIDLQQYRGEKRKVPEEAAAQFFKSRPM
jgi:ferric-dicitrate binding protein FerR (iron transport regulator)